MADVQTDKGRKVYDENYWTIVIVYFASFLIGLGIVAEIAFNWELIPTGMKLSGAIAAMALNAGALIWAIKADKKVLSQVLACVYAFLIMGVIGLIGQTFHLKSDFSRGCLLWCAVSWPLFLAVPRLLWLWLPLALTGINGEYSDTSSLIYKFDMFFGGMEKNNAMQMTGMLEVYCYLCLFGAYELWVNFKKEEVDNLVAKPLRFWSAMALFDVYCRTALSVKFIDTSAVGGTRELLMALAWTTPYLAAAFLVWLLNKKYLRKSFMPMFLTGILAEALLVFGLEYFYYQRLWIDAVIPVVFVAIMAIYAHKYSLKKLYFCCWFLLSVWFALVFADDVFYVVPSLTVCAFAALAAYRAKSRRWFNVAVLAAVLRILAHYADVGNLQFFGAYLIGSGILILTTILLLKKYGKLLWENSNEK